MSTFTSYSLNVKKDEMPCATDQGHIKGVSISHTEFNHETKAHYSVSITLFPEHIKVLEQALEILKKYQPYEPINHCPDCNGTGKVISTVCPTCGGEKDNN